MEKNHSVKTWWKLWIAVGVSALIIIISIIVIILALISGAGTPAIYYQDEILGVKISEKNIRAQSIKQGKPIYFLNKSGIDIFKQKITTRLGFGPEFFALKEIIFTEQDFNFLIDRNSNALYFPNTQQIIINLSPWIQYFNNNWNERHDYYDDITEWLFQSFYHEYHHHLANMYLLNFKIGDYLASDSIYRNSETGTREIEPWNQYFLNKFTNYLNYDKTTTLYANTNVRDLNGNILQANVTYNGITKYLPFKSIGSLYDAMTLFNRANHQTTPSYSELIDYFVDKNVAFLFTPTETNFEPAAILDKITLDFITYLFSMQELFVRKYMQLTFPFHATSQIDANGMYNIKLNDSSQKTYTTYLFDTLNYQYNFTFDEKFLYLSDAPLSNDNVANNLMELYFTINGLQTSSTPSQGANLSFIWYNNTSAYFSNEWGIQINDADINGARQVKFGGFLTPTQAANYQYIGYFDQNNVFQPTPITTYNYTYNRLTRLGSTQRQPLPVNNFYVVTPPDNGWLDIHQIMDQPLYFAKDKEGKIFEPLVSILNPDISPTWTRRFFTPLGFGQFNPTYQATLNENNFVVIQAVN